MKLTGEAIVKHLRARREAAVDGALKAQVDEYYGRNGNYDTVAITEELSRRGIYCVDNVTLVDMACLAAANPKVCSSDALT